jgi:hypothetical protein
MVSIDNLRNEPIERMNQFKMIGCLDKTNTINTVDIRLTNVR